jgi:hypothetical protein
MLHFSEDELINDIFQESHFHLLGSRFVELRNSDILEVTEGD